MKLIMTLLVRDEQDILEENIDYHLSQGVDFIIATDNLSADRTPDILKKYESKGVLHLIEETRDDYSQHEWVTRMARMAARDFGADWVINNDADEFWWPENDRDLKTYLSRVDDNVQSVTVRRQNFPMLSANGTEDLPFFERLIVRDTASENALGRPLPPKVCHRAHPNIDVAQGNHAVSLDGKSTSAHPGEAIIFHFPVRSYAQFENKIRLGGAAYARNTILNKAIGNAWRHLYDEYKAGRLQDFYREMIPTQESLSVRIASGRYVTDRRLMDSLHQLKTRSR